MSDINLLPEDLKKKEEKTLKNRGDFNLDEIEFTEGEKLKKEINIKGKLSGKNKLEKWLKPKVKISPDFKKNYNKTINTNSVPKINNDQKEVEKKLKVSEPSNNFLKVDKEIVKKQENKHLNTSIKEKNPEIEKQEDKKNISKKKKSSNFFKNLFNKFVSKTKNKKDETGKKDEDFDVNLLPFGSNVPTTRRMIYGLIIAFILTSSLIFIIYFAYFIYKGKVVNNYSSLGNELDSYMEEIKKYDDLMQETSSWQEKVTEIEHLLSKHIYWTKFFEKLEENTLSNVQFIGFAGKINNSIVLNAIAPNYQTVSKQWIRLQGADDFVKEVQINSADMSISEESIKVKFSLMLDFVDDIFYNE
jgi:hypothetical protein